MNSTTMKKALAGGVLVLSGLAVGGMAAGTMSASAATSTPSATASSSTASRSGSGSGSGTLVQTTDPTKSMRSDEHLLTGTTAEKVKAAALAKYPSATIQRVETDSDGVYEAHIVTSAGDQVIVQVGSDFIVTGTQTGGGPGAGTAGQSSTAG